jgi:hypothetical protein
MLGITSILPKLGKKSDAMKRLTLHRFNFFASVKRFIASLL